MSVHAAAAGRRRHGNWCQAASEWNLRCEQGVGSLERQGAQRPIGPVGNMNEVAARRARTEINDTPRRFKRAREMMRLEITTTVFK